MKKLCVMLVPMLLVADSYAAVDANKIYFGGGLGLNSLSGIDLSDGVGFQVFAGYELPVNLSQGSLSVEAGYMDSGNVEAGRINLGPPFGVVIGERKYQGLWGNAVFELPLQDKLNLIGRAGLDIGDDDGLMLGAGLGFEISKKMEVRGEYVIRDNIDSLQVNLVIRQ